MRQPIYPHIPLLRRNGIIRDQLDNSGPQIEAEIDQAVTTMQAISVATILLAAFAAWTVRTAIARPVVSMTGAMTALADGDTRIAIPATNHRDEDGDMAKAAEVFRQNKIRADELAEEEPHSEETRRGS